MKIRWTNVRKGIAVILYFLVIHFWVTPFICQDSRFIAFQFSNPLLTSLLISMFILLGFVVVVFFGDILFNIFIDMEDD